MAVWIREGQIHLLHIPADGEPRYGSFPVRYDIGQYFPVALCWLPHPLIGKNPHLILRKIGSNIGSEREISLKHTLPQTEAYLYSMSESPGQVRSIPWSGYPSISLDGLFHPDLRIPPSTQDKWIFNSWSRPVIIADKKYLRWSRAYIDDPTQTLVFQQCRGSLVEEGKKSWISSGYEKEWSLDRIFAANKILRRKKTEAPSTLLFCAEINHFLYEEEGRFFVFDVSGKYPTLIQQGKSNPDIYWYWTRLGFFVQNREMDFEDWRGFTWKLRERPFSLAQYSGSNTTRIRNIPE